MMTTKVTSRQEIICLFSETNAPIELTNPQDDNALQRIENWGQKDAEKDLAKRIDFAKLEELKEILRKIDSCTKHDSIFTASMIVLRTMDGAKNFLADLFLPNLINRALKIDSFVGRILGCIAAFFWDLITLPIRIITLPIRVRDNYLTKRRIFDLMPIFHTENNDTTRLDITERSRMDVAILVKSQVEAKGEDESGAGQTNKQRIYHLVEGSFSLKYYSGVKESNWRVIRGSAAALDNENGIGTTSGETDKRKTIFAPTNLELMFNILESQ